MGVVLLILRILLDLIILILGLALLLILIVMFVPIHYRVKGVVNEEEKSADFKIRWLIATVKGDYKKEEGLKYKAKVLFFTLLDSEKTDDPKKKKSKQKKNKENTENKDEIAVTNEEIKVMEEIGEPIQSALDLLDVTQDKADDNILTQDKADDSILTQDNDQQKTPLIHKVSDFLDNIGDKARDFLDKVGNKAQSLEKKADHVEQFLYKNFTQRTIHRGKKFLGKTLKAIKPRKGHGYIKFGLSNAADTGIWLGRIAMFYPIYGRWLQLEPDFYNKVFNMDCDLKGSIMIGPTAIRFLILYLRKDTKRTMNLAKKI